MMRDRLITSSSFQHGLTTLGFKLTEEVIVLCDRRLRESQA